MRRSHGSGPQAAILAALSVLLPVSSGSAQVAGQAGPEELQHPFVDRLDVSLVLVPVVVRDGKGRPVTDLERSDFQVLDEGSEVALEAFGREERDVWVDLALDTSWSMLPHVNAVKMTALEFIRAQGASTRFALVTFNDEVLLEQDFTSGREAVEQAIGAVRGGGYNTALLDTIGATVSHLASRDGARVAVVFTDGTDTVHPQDEAETRLSAGLDAALRSDVTIFTVAFGARAAKGLLRRIAEETGGEAMTASTAAELSSAFAHVAEAVGSRYLLGFKPVSGARGFRSIEVRVARPGLRIAARRRYLAQ